MNFASFNSSAHEITRWPAKLGHIAASVLLVIVIAADFFLNISHSSYIEIYDSIPDEALFYQYAKHLSDLIKDGNFAGITNFGTPYGYGFPYWLVSALLILMLPVGEGLKIFALKCVFLLLKWVAILMLARVVRRKLDVPHYWVFVAAVLSCGIFYFYGKVFSTEFLTLFLGSAVVTLLAKDNFSCGIRLPIALFLATLCLLIKATAIPIVLFVLSYLAICVVEKTIRPSALVACAVAALLAIAIAFSGVMTNESQAEFVNWMTNNTARNFGVKYLFEWGTFTGVTWDRIALSGGVGVLGVVSAIAVWSTSLQSSANIFRLRSVGVISVFSGICGLLFIVAFEGYLDWYIQLPVMLLVFGFLYSTNNTNRIGFVAVVATVGVVFLSMHDIARRIDIRLDVLHQLTESRISNVQFLKKLSEFESETGEDVFIVTDLLVALNVDAGTAKVLRARDAVTNIYEKRRGASDIALKSGGQDAEYSKATHLIINRALMDRGESPLLNMSIVRLEGACYLFEGQCFKIIDQTPGRLLLQNVRFGT